MVVSLSNLAHRFFWRGKPCPNTVKSGPTLSPRSCEFAFDIVVRAGNNKAQVKSRDSKQMAKNTRRKAKADKIKAAVEFIEAYYDRPITISDIAHEVGLSVWSLAHRFKERMGVTLIGYLTNMRIERAKNLLLTTDKKCCNLYYEVGYNSQTYFARKFKEVVGMSPTQFRAAGRSPKC